MRRICVNGIKIMKILYGVQGTGNGHISRSRLIAEALLKRGAEVDYLFSGRSADKYFDMEVFGAYQVKRGFTFETSSGAINYLKTALHFKPVRFMYDMQQLHLDDYQCVVSDFEPITAWACHRKKHHSIGISHQASFLHNIPQTKGDFFSQMTLKYFAPTTSQIGLHWYHFGCPILPPIIEKLESATTQAHILVYLPFESIAMIRACFQQFSSTPFICYHPEIKTEIEYGCVRFKPLNRSGFIDDLRCCLGVICNAGFELASEALTLGKRLLVKPLEKQYEQQTNAMTLNLLGLGEVMNTLDSKKIQLWLEQPSIGKVVYPDVAAEVASWITDEQKESLSSLSERLWKQVMYPETVLEHLDELGFGAELTQSTLIGMNRRQRQASELL